MVDLATQEEIAVLNARRLFFNAAGTQAVYFEGGRAMLFNVTSGESSELMTLAGGVACDGD